jgi:hypothetical protein
MERGISARGSLAFRVDLFSVEWGSNGVRGLESSVVYESKASLCECDLRRDPRLELGVTVRVVEFVLPAAIACSCPGEGEIEPASKRSTYFRRPTAATKCASSWSF